MEKKLLNDLNLNIKLVSMFSFFRQLEKLKECEECSGFCSGASRGILWDSQRSRGSGNSSTPLQTNTNSLN